MLSQVLERDSVLAQFAIVTKELEQALDGVPYTLLEISDEVQEQVYFTLSTIKLALQANALTLMHCTHETLL